MVKKCPYCNEVLSDNAKFCPHCFQAIPQSKAKEKNSNTNLIEDLGKLDFLNNLSFLKTRTNKILFLIIILICLLLSGSFGLLILCILIGIYFYKKNHPDYRSKQNNPKKENYYPNTNYTNYGYKRDINNLKEKEIQRLIDSLGNEEPVKGILTDEEILKYAGNSVSASRIRLKRGIGTPSDKSKVNEDILNFLGSWKFVVIFILIALLTANNTLFFPTVYIGLLVILFLYIAIRIGYYCYIMYIKDYTKSNILEYKQNTPNEDNKETNNEEMKISNNDDLLLLFESKEKIAREMIEKRFPAPQLTNIKFNAVLDNCKDVVESQIENLNALTLTEKTKYEIESRKQLIKQVIDKIDDLTNELILSEQNDIENVIDEMDDLINSIKEYK